MRLLAILPVFLVISLAAPAFATSGGKAALRWPGETYPFEIVSREGKTHKFQLEIAAAPQEQARGLMFRESMPEDHGMLFVFGHEAVRTFWMRNTLIPLDILFLDVDGRIVKIHENAKPKDETQISSELPVFAAIEINGGAARKRGIAVGDTALHQMFGNLPEAP